jgi:hypothetical protein
LIGISEFSKAPLKPAYGIVGGEKNEAWEKRGKIEKRQRGVCAR